MYSAFVYMVGEAASCFPYLATEHCRVLTFFDADGCAALDGVEPPRWVTNAGTSLCIDDACTVCTVPLVAGGVCTAVPGLNLIYRVVGEAADVYTLNGASCGEFDALDGSDGGTLSSGYVIVATIIVVAVVLVRLLHIPPPGAASNLRL